jgi:hypothetical protein
MRGKLRLRTLSYPSYDISLYIMSETFLFWTKPRRRSFGKTSSKSYVARIAVLVKMVMTDVE